MTEYRYSIGEQPICKIEPGMKEFQLNDGIMTARRACLEIDAECPSSYRNAIMDAYSKGWLKPVAYIYEHELLMTALKD